MNQERITSHYRPARITSLVWTTLSILAACLASGFAQAKNLPPKVALALPENGASFTAPATVHLAALADDADGWVKTVEFFAGDRSLGVTENDPRRASPINPFQLDWKDVPAGEYKLWAKATDDLGESAASEAILIKVAPGDPVASASLKITKPASGETFSAPATIELQATAVDPNGYISRVEFFADDKSIGVSEIVFIVAPPNGEPIHHAFTWKEVPGGIYKLFAKAIDAQGHAVVSEPVEINVKPAFEQAKVNITARKALAHELGDFKTRALVFIISRNGPRDFAMPVFYSTGGTATHGIDYAKLDGTIVISEGAESAELLVEAMPDDKPEGEESVQIKIEPPVCIKIFPPPPECYLVGELAEAKGIIADGPNVANEPPHIELTKPGNGDTFAAPADIGLEAVVLDPDGYVTTVEFFANDDKVGEQVMQFIQAPPPGQKQIFDFLWQGVKAGAYKLTAKATDDHGGTRVSEGVLIEVKTHGDELIALVKKGSDWRYLNDGQAQGNEWTGPGFDDSKWPSGPAQLGYGDSDEKTVTRPPPNEPPRPITAYFRHAFEVADTRAFSKLIFRLLRDDGAAVYLNGKEVFRSNLPTVQPLTFETLASASVGGADESKFFETSVETLLLVNGQNLLAVEIHQANANSSDISFDLELLAAGKPIPPPDLPIVNILATDPETIEPSPNTRIKPGVFALNRSGDAKEPLKVFLSVEGTAKPGFDYQPLPHEVTFPAGVINITVIVAPLDDDLVEGDETVVASLAPWPFNIPPTYNVDREHATAKVVIHDNEPPATESTLEILAPKDGEGFSFPSPITISVRAVDPKSEIWFVEFFDGDAKIGESKILSLRPIQPGQPVIHTLVWKEAKIGPHVLAVRAKDSSEKLLVSHPVKITVEPHGDFPIVSIEATVPETTELSPLALIKPGRFTVRRTGLLEQGLVVFLKYEGTAMTEKDYLALPRLLFFKPEVSSVDLEVVAQLDHLVEADESVVATILPLSPGVIVVDLPFNSLYNIDPQRSTAKVVIHDSKEPPADATLEITAPKDGEHFDYPAKITINATAIDPEGYISRVEFYDGEERIGVSEIVFIRAPDPGTPVFHTFEWNDAKMGAHVLTVRVIDAAGNALISDPVKITVGAIIERVVLEIEASDPVALEAGGPNVTLDYAVFTIHRKGPLDIEVPVFYSLDGSAKNGIDYSELSGKLIIPTGKASAEIIIKPVPDKALEGDESVVVRLEPPICILRFPPPPQCYEIGPQGEAKAIIRETAEPGNNPPKVAIVSPKNGAVFTGQTTITIRAEAADSDGKIERLDIFADDKLLDSTKLNELTVEWNDPPLGSHILTARALYDGGAESHSEPVKIVVRGADADSFVRRDLPPAYTPGARFEILLKATPPTGTSAYAVQDRPPKGWDVSHLSEGGAWDALNGEVKFGPFSNGKARLLFYSVTPPTDAKDRAEFSGLAAANGKATPIGGDQFVEFATRLLHPADLDPADNRITITELTAYTAAWKEGAKWPEGPVPIPLNYVTRAGALWKGGEVYLFDSAKGPAPKWWVNPKPARQSLAVTAPLSTAVRETVQAFQPGKPSLVQISLAPAPGATAVAVEEQVPAGWAIGNISEDGRFDAAYRIIRWGVFFDDAPRLLSYQVTPPDDLSSSATLLGYASFDGERVEITGQAWAAAQDATTELHLTNIKSLADGRVRLTLNGPVNQLCSIEVSSDLANWTELEVVLLTDSAIVVTDDSTGGASQRYYRVRILPAP